MLLLSTLEEYTLKLTVSTCLPAAIKKNKDMEEQ
jgi:hypothetical protein